MSNYQVFKPFRQGQDASVSKRYKAEKAIKLSMFFAGWQGVGNMYPHESILKCRTAARLATTKEWKYDCWIPDPDDEDCCIHMIMNEEDFNKRFVNSGQGVELSKKMEIYLSDFLDLPMADKIYKLSMVTDLLEFFGLEEVPEGVPVEDVQLVQKMTKDAFIVPEIL